MVHVSQKKAPLRSSAKLKYSLVILIFTYFEQPITCIESIFNVFAMIDNRKYIFHLVSQKKSPKYEKSIRDV